MVRFLSAAAVLALSAFSAGQADAQQSPYRGRTQAQPDYGRPAQTAPNYGAPNYGALQQPDAQQAQPQRQPSHWDAFRNNRPNSLTVQPYGNGANRFYTQSQSLTPRPPAFGNAAPVARRNVAPPRPR